MARKVTITISNIAGGDAKTFPWRGELSDRAIRHADRCERTFGGAAFRSADASAAAAAADAYRVVCEDREVAS